ncbi:MAG: succinate:quinone oxidoreductase, partial [Acidobacteriota bacterium]
VKYGSGKPPVAASLASRTLIVSGMIVFIFILFHLAHFTIGLVDARFLEFRDPEQRHDVYKMMIEGFSQPLVSIFYIFALGLLCLHLSHGVSSMFQSLGLKNKAWDKAIDRFAKIATAILFIGNCAIVIAVWAGFVR